MNVRLFLLERWLPGWVRRRMLRELAGLTAEAFGADAPVLARRPRNEAISIFAAFTRREVERVLAGEGTAAVETIRGRLYDGAREMGRAVRRDLGIAARADALRAVRLLYRGIGIVLDADEKGDVAVRACAFSGVYTPAVCAFISALDAGLVSGLTGGSTLVFSERITEGASCCRATLIAAAERPRPGVSLS
jgi:hypothetical protein